MTGLDRLVCWHRARAADERGALSAAMPIIAFSLLVLAGLGIDGSRVLNARAQAVAYAEEAARSGALAIYPGRPQLELDTDLVTQRVDDYCAAAKAGNPEVLSCAQDGPPVRGRNGDGTPEARALIVQVRVQTQIRPVLLGMVYPGDLKASGVGSARPIEGRVSRTQ